MTLDPARGAALSLWVAAAEGIRPSIERQLCSGEEHVPALLNDFEQIGLSNPAKHLAEALVVRRVALRLTGFNPEASPRELLPPFACPRLSRLWSLLDFLETEHRAWARDLDTALADLRPATRADPLASLYEAILQRGDRMRRRRRGVFYTPPLIARFILKELEGRLTSAQRQGRLSEGNLGVLDPAGGSGTFLVELIRLVGECVPTGAMRQACLRGLIAGMTSCEVLPAACLVAHVRLWAAFREAGHVAESGDRLRVFWTNSLCDPSPAWQDRTYNVIVGNPPFGQGAVRTAPWLNETLERLHDGIRQERNRQPLADAYVKFLAMACALVRESQPAAIGMIVNRSCFDGRLHGGLRRMIRETFSNLAVLDLGGETRAGGERIVDQNLFPITQGVGIILGSTDGTRFEAARLAGSRSEKLAVLDCRTIDWSSLETRQTSDAWTPSDGCALQFRQEVEAEYARHPALCDLMPFRSPGVKTSCDSIAYAFSRQELESNVRSAGWEWDERRAVRALYRPGDVRWLYYDPPCLGRPRPELARHVLSGTPSLITMRQFVGTEFSHLAVCRGLACHGVFYLGNRGQDYLFPITLESPLGRVPNIHRERLPESLHSPERLLHYVSAIILSPGYRRRYRDLLPRDFPRIPVARDQATIDRLCGVGKTWVDWQLWLHADGREPDAAWQEPLATSGIKLAGDASPGRVDAKAGVQRDLHVELNRFTRVGPLPEHIWTMRFGGYRACETFWKARRGRRITPDDVGQFRKLAMTLEATSRLCEALEFFDPAEL